MRSEECRRWAEKRRGQRQLLEEMEYRPPVKLNHQLGLKGREEEAQLTKKTKG